MAPATVAQGRLTGLQHSYSNKFFWNFKFCLLTYELYLNV